MSEADKIKSLRKEIEASGGPDKYIDVEEEEAIFKKGASLGLERNDVESELNQMCLNGEWTRESDIVPDLKDILEESTMDDGAIDKREFEHCVNYGVSMNMPRQDAMRYCVRYIIEKNLKIKKGFFGKDWFTPLKNSNQ